MLFTVTTIALLSVLTVTATAFDHVRTQQVVYDYFDEALLTGRKAPNAVNWQAAEVPLVRDFNPFDEDKIGQAISEAWTGFAAAQDTGKTGALPDYFSGVALERARLASAAAHEAGTRLATLSLTGTPAFYHLDGSLFQARFETLNIRFAEDIDTLLTFHATIDTSVTTLMNESSGWRVYSHERIAAQTVSHDPVRVPEMRLTGINYYPALTPWREFWASFDLAVIEADFDKVKSLGGNSVRVFLPRDDFLETDKERHLDNLNALLEAAAARGLSVVPTLFDLKSNYALAGWSNDAIYLRSVLPVLAGHRAVAFVDLKNEPDLDFATHGRARVEAWVRSMALVTRQLAPHLPLTIGWSASGHAHVAADTLDLITYHDYAPIDGAADRLTQVKRIAGDKPVMITEIGESSWSLVAGSPGSPRKQARLIADRMDALAAADGLFVWTLHDFPDPDPAAIGNSPWVRGKQSEFGLFAENGTAKPAADAVTTGFRTFQKGQKK
ncbi:glycoside hydrolase 5 family protein [Arenibacterium sp. CAU 1754]